ncbi:dihydrofolate reductase [Gloeobacter violaceus]|uniref:Dihydrofolate reductase n=1 Tax=Gloeobacter violaceus (strain ATCC 29082 / PCC 7421) TaxID=251221 RepID=Q7NHQ9_GLOVI|nr:dihydrofolate reductase [Gloeobacter violaceus]BAC90417.1 dihydrofolate reductase [Gloeobacter violaceus PCC 7421]
MELIAVVAMDSRRLIGRGDGLPWHCPEDLSAFKALTWGQPLLMGRRTFESILARRGKPLPEREHYVLTARRGPSFPTVRYICSPDQALALPVERLFVIGGASVYAQTADQLDTLYLSLIPGLHTGDVFLPDLGNRWAVEIIEKFQTFKRWRLLRSPSVGFDWSQLVEGG